MSKKISRLLSAQRWGSSVARLVVAGIVVVALVFAGAGYVQSKSLESLAEDVTGTLKQQCISYDKLVSTDRTKSLFRLTDIVRDLTDHLGKEGAPVTDKYLESYVDGLRISGVSVLDKDLKLEAAGYTRHFKDGDWMGSALGSNIADIVKHPAKVFTQRVAVGGDYYDVCAVARKDKTGIVIGFYKQPTGLVADMESDLASLLSGLRLEREGEYAIVEDGVLRASSDESLEDLDGQDESMLTAFAQMKNDGKLELVHAQNGTYWGYRSACGNYDLYIYYPFATLFLGSLLATGVVSVVILLLCLGYSAIRSRGFYQNQRRLEKSNRELTEMVDTLKSLESIFFTLFRIDLANNRYETIYLAPWLEGAIKREGIYTDLRQLFLNGFIVPEHREMMDEQMSRENIKAKLSQKAISDVRRSFYVDYQAIRGGQRRWCRVTATVVDYDKSGYPSHVLVLLQDVDEEKAKETAYQERILQESHAAKVANEAKNEFLRRISHDIRTPINGIKGYVQLAERHPEDTELQQHCRDNEMVAIDALMSLVNSVLDMVKLEGREVSLVDAPFDLQKLLEDTATVLQPQASSLGITCSVDVEDNELNSRLIGSSRHVSQVLMNLLGNGIKYGRRGGYVRMTSRLVERTGSKATYEFVCEDNGIGMSEEFQGRMFEPFTQEDAGARTVYDGSGLGLSIVRKLVEAMDGSIEVSSQKNVGTTFKVRLPFGIDEKARREKTLDNSHADALQGRNVLLVEDNELNMEIAAYLLEDCGAQVTKAWNGKEAVDIFAASAPGEFDLIITDVLMPVMDGLEEVRRIRALERPDARTIPIVAASANAFSEDAQASHEAGIDAYVAKPIDTAKMLRVVGELLARAEK